MNDPATYRPSEIALAYERHFAPLEAARKEYAESVVELLRALECHVVNAASRSEPPLRVESKLEGREFESSVVFRIHVGALPSGFFVRAMPAAPNAGTAGCLRIEVFGWFDEKLAPLTRDSAFDRNGVFSSSDRSKGFLAFQEVPVAEHGIEAAAAAVLADIERLVPFAVDQVEEEEFNRRMNTILNRLLPRLTPPPKVASSWTMSKIGDWEGMHFIQAGLPNKRELWVGYHARDARLMYGHYEIPGDPHFQHRFFATIGASQVQPASPFTHGKLPAGILLEADNLRGKSDQDLEEVVVRTFHCFFELLTESQQPGAFSDASVAEHL